MKNPLLKRATRFSYPEKAATRGMSGVYSDMYAGGLFDKGKDFPPEIREQVKKTVFGSVKIGQRRSKVATGEMSSEDVTREAYPAHFAIAEALDGTVQPFDVYQGPCIDTQYGRLFISMDGDFAVVWNETNTNESNPFFYENDNEAVDAALSTIPNPPDVKPWGDWKREEEEGKKPVTKKKDKKIRKTPQFNEEDTNFLRSMGITGSKLALLKTASDGGSLQFDETRDRFRLTGSNDKELISIVAEVNRQLRRRHIPEDPKAHDAALRRIARTMKVGEGYAGMPHKPRLYRCLNCGHEQNISTNHTGSVLDYCHGCSWKRSWRGDGRYGDKTAPEMSFSLPALGGHTYRPFEYVGSIEKEHPLTDSDKDELKSMGVQASFIVPSNSKIAESTLTQFAKQAAKATHILYDAGPTSFTVRVMKGNDTIDEHNGGNSPYDSVSEFGRTDSDAIEYKRLLGFAENTAKQMAEEYGVPEDMVQHDEDLMAEEREEAGMDFTSEDHGVLREMGIKGSKEASRYYPHDPRIPFSDDARPPYGVELRPETLPQDDPEAKIRVENKRQQFKSKMLQQGARQRDRVPVNNKKYSEDDLNYLLDWFSNMFGALKPDIRKRLMRVINNPTEKTWSDAYSIILNGEGKMTTLWQAVIKVDPWFPKRGPSEDLKGNRIEGWEKIPDQKTLIKAFLSVAGLNSMPTKPTLENPFSAEDKKIMEQMGIQASTKPKCPHCGSDSYVLMPTDFETAKCDDCGKNWDHGIVKGINDPSDKTGAQHRQWWPYGRHEFEPQEGIASCKACDYPADHKLHTTPPPEESVRKDAANCYKTPSLRGPNLITQNGAGRRMESPDGSRWAISANRKRSLGNHRYDSVEVWTLKRRDSNGRVEIVDTDRSEEAAEQWVMGESKTAFFSPEDATKFRADNGGSSVALHDIDERDGSEEADDYRRWEPVFDDNGKPIARTACLPCEYCPQCHKDAERCRCSNKVELLDGKTVGDRLDEEKTATPHDQEAFADGPSDFFEPVENPHSIQPLRASVKTATVYKVEEQSRPGWGGDKGWFIAGLPTQDFDGEKHSDTLIIPGLNHSLSTPEGLAQGIYEQLYDEFQVNDNLKAGDIFDTPVGQFICEGVHVMPYDDKALAILKVIEEQYKCANCGCDQGDHRREYDPNGDQYFECMNHPDECKEFRKKVKTAALPPPPPAIVEEAHDIRPLMEFPLQVQAPSTGVVKPALEPQPFETPSVSGHVKPALRETLPEGNTHMYIDQTDGGYKEI